MVKTTTLFVGLDVHKDSISVAHAEANCSDPRGISRAPDRMLRSKEIVVARRLRALDAH